MRVSALLVGVENYGAGFTQLPAVARDIEALSTALEKSGATVETIDEGDIKTATDLVEQIESFCKRQERDTVALVYYSGHGINGNDGQDYIVPPKAQRASAYKKELYRVPTDLRRYLSDVSARLVVLIVDACRDNPADSIATKGGGWGHDLEDISERFVRFLGCGPSQLCHIYKDKDSDGEISLFTRALADVLASDEALSLNELKTRAVKRCSELMPSVEQVPRLSGELPEHIIQILDEPLFKRTDKATTDSWPKADSALDPSRFHYVVIRSETDSKQSKELASIVEHAIEEAGDAFWSCFRTYWSDRTLLNGDVRAIPADFTPAVLVAYDFIIDEALETDTSLNAAVRAVLEADLAVFDVTGFEPGVMLLLGVRSALRRGVTLCSHGAGWQPGSPLSAFGKDQRIPFNLQDLSLTGHSPPDPVPPDSDPVVERFASRIATGFREFAEQPRYLDLPAYDAVHNLGPTFEAGREIGADERVLLLCPFSKPFTERNLLPLKRDLSRVFGKGTRIQRVLDLESPRVISQAIYENVRRVSACVADWTGFSPSVFLELGARLTVSELGAMHVFDKKPSDEVLDGTVSRELRQIKHLKGRFHAVGYILVEGRIAVDSVVEEFLKRNPAEDEHKSYRCIYDIASASIERFRHATLSVDVELSRQADSLDYLDKKRQGGPQILFRPNASIKRDAESAALQRRVAAWLYLEHRIHAYELAETDEAYQAYVDIGRAIQKGLRKTKHLRDRELANFIRKRLLEQRGQSE